MQSTFNSVKTSKDKINYQGVQQIISVVNDILEQLNRGEARVKPRIEFDIGETVKIKDGAFENFEGKIENIDPDRGKLKLSVSIFGRYTPVEVEYWQVER